MKPLKNLLQKVIPKDKKLYTFLKRIYRYRHWKPRRINNLEKLIQAYNKFKEGNITFIQVGSNDGIHGDPIRNFIVNNKWRGVLVEPIPETFERLKYNYRNEADHVNFENVAVGELTDQPLLFYYIDNTDNSLPEWASQLGSFDPTVILKHTEYIPDIKNRLVGKEITVKNFGQILIQNQFSTIDLVHIDTEGYDYVILKQIDLAKFNPEFIIYEHKHLGDEKYKESIKYLSDNDYKLYFEMGDTVAIRNSVFKNLEYKPNWF